MFDFRMDRWRYEPKPGGFQPLGAVDTLVVHWIGGGNAPHSESDVIAALQSVYRGHINHPVEPYSDIAYNAAVDAAGRTWELRGMQYQGGATFGANMFTKAILYVGGSGEPVTDAALRRIALFRNQAIAEGFLIAGCAIRAHRDYVATDCPGDLIYSQLGYVRGLANLNPLPQRNFDAMDAWSKIGPAVFGRFAGHWLPISEPEWLSAKQKGIEEIPHTAAEMQTIRGDWGRG